MALKNLVVLGLDSNLSAPGRASGEEMFFVLESRVLEKSKLSPLLGTNIFVSA